jgi:folate-binding protein YgfZ
MSKEWNLFGLSDFGVLRFRGPDGVKFLQGQLSQDVEKLSAERSLVAGYHNPQGRAIALVRLVQWGPEDLLAVMPRELTATVASRLMKFVLRAKVKITEESSAWRLTGLVAPSAAGELSATERSARESPPGRETSAAFEGAALSWAAAQFASASATVATEGETKSAAAQLEEAGSIVELPEASAFMLPDGVNAQSRSGATAVVRVGASPARWLILSPVEEPLPVTGCAVGERDAWRLLDIADGVAQVYAATSEEFVAQMLNLDALGGIAFDKGCYTGQEVIARAHYRGRVKRRMQRFFSRGVLKLAPGESGQLTDGRTFKVVDAVQLANGRSEFLAVAPVVAGAAEDAAPGTASTAPAAATVQIDAEVLPLAYALPE